jgi:hypothetical protein
VTFSSRTSPLYSAPVLQSAQPVSECPQEVLDVEEVAKNHNKATAKWFEKLCSSDEQKQAGENSLPYFCGPDGELEFKNGFIYNAKGEIVGSYS